MTTSTSIGSSAAAIEAHYDVGNGFYRLWLDRSLTYSCGLWLSCSDDLEQAQINKMDWHLRKVGVRKGTRLLDIGCGWGATMSRAVVQHGASAAMGLTLSANQERWIRETAPANVDVCRQSWSEYRSDGPYDAAVSIGSFEHFARLDQDSESKLNGYKMFFEFCHDALGEHGRLSLQTIVYDTTDRSDFSSFFAREVFPESDLPHLEEVIRASRGLFEIEELRNDREHYENTVREWLRRLRAQRRAATEIVGEATVTRYERFFNLLIIGFHLGRMNLTRIAMRRR